jgi:Cu2+-containing amine oxidase
MRVAAEFRIRAQGQPPIDTRRPSFMLKLNGFFDRNPALDVPALGGHCHAKAS